MVLLNFKFVYYSMILLEVVQLICHCEARKPMYPTKRKKASSYDLIAGIYIGRESISHSLIYGDLLMPISDFRGNLETPICIAFDDNGKALVGKEALYYQSNYSAETLQLSLTQLIGKTYTEIKKSNISTKNIINKHNKPVLNIVRQNGQINFQLTIEELFSYFFGDIKQKIESTFKVKLSMSVISVDAFYDDNQFMALKAAANKAGLKILDSEREHILASYYYKSLDKDEELMLTIDTSEYDTILSIISFQSNRAELINQRAFKFSQIQIQNQLFKWISNRYEEIFHHPIIDNVNMAYMLNRKVKDIINTINIYPFTYFYWHSIGVESTIENNGFEISRTKYNEIIQTVYDEFFRELSKFLIDSEISRYDMTNIIVYGVSTDDLKLIEQLKYFFNTLSKVTISKMNQYITHTTGMLASKATERQMDIYFVEKNFLNKAISIGHSGELCDTIIPANTPIPVKIRKQYTLNKDYQDRIMISVFEGDYLLQIGNMYLGKVFLNNVTYGERGVVKFDVEVMVEQNNDIIVKVVDITENNWKILKIIRDFDRIPPDSERIKDTSEKGLKREEFVLKFVEVRNMIEPLAYELKYNLKYKTKSVMHLPIQIVDHALTLAEEVINFFETFGEVEDTNRYLKIKDRFLKDIFIILQAYYPNQIW